MKAQKTILVLCAIGVIILGANLAKVAGEGNAPQPTGLAHINQQLNGAVDEASISKLVDQGRSFIDMGPAVPSEEVLFVTRVFDASVHHPEQLADFRNMIAKLKARYKDDPSILIRLISLEASQKSVTDDYPAARALYEEAHDVADRMTVADALAQYNTKLQLGLSLLSGNENDRATALSYFKDITTSMSFDPPYLSRINEFKDIYIRAAERIIQLSPIADLRKIRFQPFAWGTLESEYPKEAAQMSTEVPGVAESRDKIRTWLKIALQRQEKGSPMAEHLSAVLDFLNSNE